MLKLALASALALAAMGSPFAIAQTRDPVPAEHASATDGAPVIRTAHIVRLKAVLRLTAAQARYWPPVERVLRALARARVQLDTTSQQRLMFAALPLIRCLSDEQKQNALAVARSMGFTIVASAM